MNWIACAVFTIIILVVIVALAIYFVLKKSSQISHSSEYIINKFEPDNTAPKITELVEFHKKNKGTKYFID